MCIDCLACTRLYAPCLYLVSVGVRRGCLTPGTGGVDGCESPCWLWESNLGPVQEQQVLLTPEPTRQHPLPPLLMVLFLTLRESSPTRMDSSFLSTLHPRLPKTLLLHAFFSGSRTKLTDFMQPFASYNCL